MKQIWKEIKARWQMAVLGFVFTIVALYIMF